LKRPSQKSLPTSPAYRRQAFPKGGEVFYWNSIKDSAFPPLKKGSCEKIEEKKIISKDLSIISTPQSPKIEFFHSFRGMQGDLTAFQMAKL